MGVCRALLGVNRALLGVNRALLDVCKPFLGVCRALLGVCMGSFGCKGHMYSSVPGKEEQTWTNPRPQQKIATLGSFECV